MDGYTDPQVRAQSEIDGIVSKLETETGLKLVDGVLLTPGQVAIKEAAQSEVPATPAKAPDEAPVIPAQEQVAAQPPADDATAQARYDTLKGKYDKEVPRFQAENRRLVSELTGARSRIADLEKVIREQPMPDPVIDTDTPAYKTLEKEYGPDAAKAMATMAANTAATEVTKAVGEATAPLREDSAQQATETYHMQIAVYAGPDWMQVNNSQEFTDWTFSNSDPVSGLTYNEQLNSAYASNDAQRVSRFFVAYKAALEANKPPEAVNPINDQGQPTNPEQAAMVAPPTSATPDGLQQVEGQGRYFTEKEVDAFYNAASKGHYVGKETEFKALEAEITDAFTHNRITR